MKFHTVAQGDTLSRISLKYYGVASKYTLIVAGNSFLGDRVQKGVVASDGSPLIYPKEKLNIPIESENIVNPLNSEKTPDTINAEIPDMITIDIEGNRFRFFTGYSITTSISSFDTFSISSPYEDNELFRETFQPLKYKNATVYYGTNKLFEGILLAPVSENNSNSQILSLSMYPKCGVLSDCSFPYASYPLEHNGLNLKQIATDSANIFGVKVEFIGDPGAVFDKVSPEPTQKILDYIIGLAKDRGFLVTNNTEGDLLIWKIPDSEDVSYTEEGSLPLLSCTPSFDPQNYFSEITGLNPVTEDTEADSYTWKNPFLDGIIRPVTIELKDTVNADLQSDVESFAGRMFGNAGRYSQILNTHMNDIGGFYRAGQYMASFAPKSNIYRRTRFLIDSATLSKADQGGSVSSLNLVLPGAYDGTLPKVVPWVA